MMSCYASERYGKLGVNNDIDIWAADKNPPIDLVRGRSYRRSADCYLHYKKRQGLEVPYNQIFLIISMDFRSFTLDSGQKAWYSEVLNIHT
jgi:hypothetical protein